MGNSNFCCSNKPGNNGEITMSKDEKQTIKITSIGMPNQDNMVEFGKAKNKGKGDIEQYLDSAENENGEKNNHMGLDLKRLIKVQTIVRRYLKTLRFLKEEKHNLSERLKNRILNIQQHLEIIKNESIKNRQGMEKAEYGTNKNPQFFNVSNMNDNFDFVGNKVNGMKEGFGLQKWRDGAIYKGYFNENRANGYGVFRHHDGDVYKGEFVNDRAIGYGIYIHANGALYQGYWSDDCQNGIGEESWNDQSHYMGEYYKGKKQGIGSYLWADCSRYEGEWFENCLHGYGTYFFNDSRVYSGQWLYNSMHGYGEFKWADGKKYIGYYIHDKKEGFGIYYWANPLRIYMGFWKNGKQDGVGKFFNGNKPAKFASWKNGDKEYLFQDEEQAFQQLLPSQQKYIRFFQCSLLEITQFLG